MTTGRKRLRDLADEKGILIGAAVSPDLLETDAQYSELIKNEFNCIVAENVMKFSYLQPERGTFDFSKADRLVDFARENDLKLRGHTLCWHHQLPDWLRQATWSRREAMDVLEEHIATVITHFKGDIFCWDVVNEAIEDTYYGLRDSNPFFRFIGPDYIEWAFKWAHRADPEVQLFYNDYDLQAIDPKYDRAISLIEQLKADNTPIHGLGFQFHTMPQDAPSKEAFRAKLDQVTARFGIVTQVTELDINISPSPDEKELAFQADVYRNTFEACLEAEGCTGFVTWGVCDKYTWIPSFTKGKCDNPLLFDKQYRPKPAYSALVDALTSA